MNAATNGLPAYVARESLAGGTGGPLIDRIRIDLREGVADVRLMRADKMNAPALSSSIDSQA